MLNLFKRGGISALCFVMAGATLAVGVINSNAWAGSLGLGERVYNVPRAEFASIVGLEYNGTFVIRFESGALSGQTGAGWSRDDLAALKGCQGDLCVGQEVYNVTRAETARIAALQTNGSYVLTFLAGALSGQSGAGWSRNDLAVERGCSASGNFCVGSAAYNVVRNERVSIFAIQASGQLVLRFEDGALAGQIGAGWSESDLAIVQQATPAYPRPVTPVFVPGSSAPGGQHIASCTTYSRGLRFTLTAPTLSQARLGVIDRCSRDPRTDKVECAKASSCEL